MSQDEWLPTSQAAKALGCSPTTLKRARDDQDSGPGYLVSGQHFQYMPSSNASILWNVPRIRETFHERGVRRRRAERELQKIQTGQEG